MKNIVLSIGGSILLTDHGDVEYIKRLAGLLEGVSSKTKLFVVVGGGRLAREYIAIARRLGSDETYLDEIGIMATRMNAMLLISALKDMSNPMPYSNVETALEHKDMFKVIVMCGTNPQQTTDAVAASLAERLDAAVFINATAVDGVYDKDPKKDRKAKMFKNMTYDGLDGLVSGSLTGAGSHAPMDAQASRIIKRAKIRTYVLNGRDLPNFENALIGKAFKGTIISNR